MIIAIPRKDNKPSMINIEHPNQITTSPKLFPLFCLYKTNVIIDNTKINTVSVIIQYLQILDLAFYIIEGLDPHS